MNRLSCHTTRHEWTQDTWVVIKPVTNVHWQDESVVMPYSLSWTNRVRQSVVTKPVTNVHKIIQLSQNLSQANVHRISESTVTKPVRNEHKISESLVINEPVTKFINQSPQKRRTESMRAYSKGQADLTAWSGDHALRPAGDRGRYGLTRPDKQ